VGHNFIPTRTRELLNVRNISYHSQSGIIPSRRNNPQTNGKLERFWYEYNKHWWRFGSLQEFLKWYNCRIHGSLAYMNGKSPGMAFIRKMPMLLFWGFLHGSE
jgi:transposase InsO family protein